MPRHVHRFDELRQTRNSFKQEVIDYFRTHTQLETINHFRISESSLYRFAKEMNFRKSRCTNGADVEADKHIG